MRNEGKGNAVWRLLKIIVFLWFTIFFIIPLLIGSAIRQAHSAPMTDQISGALIAVSEVRTMKIINDHCHYASDREVNDLSKQIESFAKDWVKQYPYMVSNMPMKQKEAFSHASKADIKKYCDMPELKKYFMSMYNTYAANEGQEQD
jgi:hypothetical protein